MMTLVAIITLVAILALVAACASPEATRTRAGGSGADVGNRTKIVQMHEGSKPFHKTPQIIRKQPVSQAAAPKADQPGRK
jgi:hypothetical protein